MIKAQAKLPSVHRRGIIFAVYHERGNCAGFTLVELMVVLALVALLLTAGLSLGTGVYDRIDSMQFDAECEHFLEEILATRNKGLMTFSEPSVCRIYQDHALFSYYDSKGEQHKTRMDFETFSVLGLSSAFEILFYPSGTVSRSRTFQLKSKKGRIKLLVFQLGTGQIHLEDEK